MSAPPVTARAPACGAQSRDNARSTRRSSVTPPRVPGLVLSLFPGIDLLGRPFEDLGFCVVRGPDPLWAGDVRDFRPPGGIWEGVIGGPPCQDFSGARRDAPTGEGLQLLGEWCRVVEAAAPEWWLMENVLGVPDVHVDGYAVQRFNLNAREVGSPQHRPRRFQFGSLSGLPLVIPRREHTQGGAPCAMATEGGAGRARRRGWAEFCQLQGLPPLDLPGMTLKGRYRAVGNGVPLPMGRALAQAILARGAYRGRLCICECGRPVGGRRTMATPACRKRMERRRKRDPSRGPARRLVTAEIGRRTE